MAGNLGSMPPLLEEATQRGICPRTWTARPETGLYVPALEQATGKKWVWRPWGAGAIRVHDLLTRRSGEVRETKIAADPRGWAWRWTADWP